MLLHHGTGALLFQLAYDRSEREVGAAQLGVLGEVQRAAKGGSFRYRLRELRMLMREDLLYSCPLLERASA